MGFSVKGDYFEACTCDVSCPCVWGRPATQDHCDVFAAWHVADGQKDGVDVAGLNVVMAVSSPKQMTDGGWKVALYVDDRASAEQSEALGAVFSGQAGGYLAALGPLIGEVVGVRPATIAFDREGRTFSAKVDEVLSMSSEELVGMDGESAGVISNALLGVVPQPLRQASATQLKYHDHWQDSVVGTNSFTTDFAYEG